MTSSLIPTMTQLNALTPDDDQQVPDTNSVVATVNFNGDTVKKSLTKPHIPDFTSLLLDPLNSSLDTPDLVPTGEGELSYPNLDTTSAFMEKAGIYWEAFDSDELSLYDGLSGLKPVKEEQLPKAEILREDTLILDNGTSVVDMVISTVPQQQQQLNDQTPLRPSTLELLPQALPLSTATTPDHLPQNALSPYSETSSASCSPADSPMSDPVFLQDFEESVNKMDVICRQLWIPKDPYHWNNEHVQKWALWTLKDRYNLEYQTLPMFNMDGTSICMLPREDFNERMPEVGNYLFAELEWWKSIVMSQKGDNEKEVIYTDLSNSVSTSTTCNNYTAAPSATAAAMTSLTSSMNSTSSASSMDSIPKPVFGNLEMTQSTLYQINSEVEMQQQRQQQHHHQQQQPFTGGYVSALNSWDDVMMTCDANSSGSSSGCSRDFSLSPVEIKKEYIEEEEDVSEDEDEMGGVGMNKRRYVSHSKHTVHLWQFLKDLLLSPDLYGNFIKWIDRSKGIFKIENSAQVAKLWGKRKNRPAMNYDKLSRSIRQYYKKGIIKKTTQSKRLVYQFQPSYL